MPSTLSPRLVKAIASGDAEALRKAIEKGDSISDGALSEPMKVIDTQRQNVRESAATLAVKFEDMEMICAVLDAGANVHVQNSTGDTPASIAAYRNLPGVIPLLYIHGSDLGQVTTGNLHHTPLAWAAWNDSVVSAGNCRTRAPHCGSLFRRFASTAADLSRRSFAYGWPEAKRLGA